METPNRLCRPVAKTSSHSPGLTIAEISLSVWRSADNTGGQHASLAKAVAAVWVLVVTMI